VSAERLEILRKLQAGELSVEEGLQLIDQLDVPPQSVIPSQPPMEVKSEEVNPSSSYSAVQSEINEPGMRKWRVFGWLGFSLFVLITALSAYWMVASYQNKPFGFGFWFSWIPFLIGILGMVFTFNARWIHIRVRQKPGEKPQNINISLPIPFGLVNTIINLFPNAVPANLRAKDFGGMVKEMSHNLSAKEPLHIVVDDEDGEHVEIYIG
jgi:hypothetical protein